MPPRRFLGGELKGFAALCISSNFNFMNLPMSYEQRLWLLEGEYYCVLAKIEEDDKYKDDSYINLLGAGTRLLLDQAGVDYKAKYESHSTMDDNENKYRTLLCQIFGKLTELQGKTKMIENERMVQDEA
jgi:hypothetical protein